ncbi:MAG: polysaccharide biosynthesis protein, partial [Rhizobiaceae bacterium]|nr:polysaccharide biosynthesis protein [Rhizobiaceae bacterium]
GYEAFYSPDWKRLDVPKCYYDPYPGDYPRPERYAEMLEIAEKMASETDFMRVDQYAVADNIYVGELTLYPGGGFKGCIPDSLDQKLGSLWKQNFRKV